MLSIDLHPPHLDELDALPASEELELERRYARSREFNPELYVLGARCCLVSRRWNVISRRLLYTSIKMADWVMWSRYEIQVDSSRVSSRRLRAPIHLPRGCHAQS